MEEVSVIPKTAMPETLDDCRNISCTSVFSKLAESFMIDHLLEEIGPAESQFGAFKGTGSVHLLAELITDSMACLDDNRAVSSIVSLDLSKAFNRMNHNHCLEALRQQGASNHSLSMAANFLQGRAMRIKLPGGHFSSSRLTPGGAPQGTKSGNLFFCVAALALKDETTITVNNLPQCSPLPAVSDLTHSEPSSPLGGSTRDYRITSSKSEEEWPVDALEEYHLYPPRWKDDPLSNYEFIDDMTAHEKCNIDLSFSQFSTRKKTKLVWSKKAETFFDNVKANCDRLGMKLNDVKTQLICVTLAINYDVRSFIRLPHGTKYSSDTLKIMGFTFGRRPGPGEHIKCLRKSYGARAWVIRHLKKIGMEQDLLVRIYCSLIRPVFECASPAFHTTMTAQQSKSLEKLQRSTLKTIFGENASYPDCLEKAGISSLFDRRKSLFRAFTLKAYNSGKFRARWFTEKATSSYALRRNNKVEETFARCDRLQDAP